MQLVLERFELDDPIDPDAQVPQCDRQCFGGVLFVLH